MLGPSPFPDGGKDGASALLQDPPADIHVSVPKSSQLSQPELGILEVTAPCHSSSGTVGDTVNVGILLGSHEVLAQALGTKQECAFRRGF